MLIFLLLGLVSCTEAVALDLPLNTAVEVVSNGNIVKILPSDNKHNKLRSWLGNNEQGWQAYYATNPGGGVIVRSEGFVLQFRESVAYLQTSEGLFSKQIEESDYAFLIL